VQAQILSAIFMKQVKDASQFNKVAPAESYLDLNIDEPAWKGKSISEGKKKARAQRISKKKSFAAKYIISQEEQGNAEKTYARNTLVQTFVLGKIEEAFLTYYYGRNLNVKFIVANVMCVLLWLLYTFEAIRPFLSYSHQPQSGTLTIAIVILVIQVIQFPLPLFTFLLLLLPQLGYRIRLVEVLFTISILMYNACTIIKTTIRHSLSPTDYSIIQLIPEFTMCLCTMLIPRYVYHYSVFDTVC